ncbi:MAG: hypothetical protein ACRDVD_01245 [Acidimicrobiia bacterium]
MSPLSQTITRSFTGDIQLEDRPVTVSLGFADGMVHLRLGGDSVGHWPASAVEFVPNSDGAYELRADGDSIPFQPHQSSAFAAFLRDSFPADPSEVTPTPAEQPRSGLGSGSAPEPTTWSEPMVGNGHDEGLPADYTEEEPESLLSWDEPDEYYAAGLNGPPSTTTPNFFRSVLAEPDQVEPEERYEPEPAVYVRDSWHHAEETTPAVGEADLPPVSSESPPAEPESVHDQMTDNEVDTFEDTDQAPDAWSLPEEPTENPTEVDAPSPQPPPVAPEFDGAAPEVTPVPEAVFALPRHPKLGTGGGPVTEEFPSAATPSAPVDVVAEGDSIDAPIEVVPDPEASSGPSLRGLADRDAARLGDTGISGHSAFAGLLSANPLKASLGSFRARLSKVADRGSEGEENSGRGFFKLPEPADDAENIRQWVVVVAGGLAAVVLLTIVVLGLSAIFSSDVTPAEPTTTTAAAPVVAAPEVTTTTAAVAPASSIVTDNTAEGFVAQWNALASTYAFNLAIEADSLPISTPAGQAIHLSYDGGGSLTLDMTPQGSAADRDLLIAMGMAVAWAEPTLDPEARADVLNALGIDVGQPDLLEVGGELTRGSITYRATVIDGIIRFSVVPVT